MLAQEQSDALTAIGFEQPADFIPGAKLEGALDDQICIAVEIQLR